ncbi:early light-induced protein 1 [Pyrus ussuriensis x Pyrus communis]|uniref:Early light-induced protein 1 n=1 Tax=Pyrus ussuriensis x Pyrus communis TaxID=2448454 RepID=A0A5N5G0Z0_9ROSA|nr:early light-induced protein 1 [Pyrus ussuriensis x Pyrus communis]
MAATISMQSIFTSSLAYGVGKSRVNQMIVPANYAPINLRKHAHVRVIATAKDEQKEQPTTVTDASENSEPAPSSPLPPPSPKVSPKFSNVLAFSGPAPERINGRLAMVGFVAALAAELSKGQGVFAQISKGSGIPLFLGTSILLLVASLVPLFKGVSVELAMLGLVALAFAEYVKGGTLV